MRLKMVALVGAVGFAVGGLYWGSAYYAAASFQRAYARGDTASVDRAFDWNRVVPDVEHQVALSFADPNAITMAKFAGASYRSNYLRYLTSGVPLVFRSQGFENFDEYVLHSEAGNTTTFSRRCVQWLIEHIGLSLNNARLLGI